MPEWILYGLFFVIAFTYASVGFGGGSSYLAVLSYFSLWHPLPFADIRLIALVCNVIVVTGGTIVFFRRGLVSVRRLLPMVLVSVPLAYLGARVALSQHVFFVLLGSTLVLTSIFLWVDIKANSEALTPGGNTMVANSTIGGAIGFLSGLVGIGGGIFLSPLLHITRWDTAKKIAAAASVFILVNSIAGIAGQASHPHPGINMQRIVLLGAAVLAGGQLGTWLGVNKFNPLVIRRVTAALVLIAGLEVLKKHLF